MLEELEKRLEFIKAYQEETHSIAKKFVTDKDRSLEERWQVFHDFSLGKNEPFVVHFDVLEKTIYEGNLSYFDDFYIHKYQKVYVVTDIVDVLEDRLRDEYYIPIATLTQGNIDLLKEEILDKFIRSFEYDW